MVKVLKVQNIQKINKDPIINLVHFTISLKKQALIFNSSKRGSEKCAEDLAKTLKKKEDLEEIAKKIENALETPTPQCKKLGFCIRHGVAFHHSGLTTKQRTLVEQGFKNKILTIISSTPTLSAGINLPAYKVIIKDYKRFSKRGMNDIPVLEYHQMSGRAGRFGYENIGKSILYVSQEKEIERLVSKYILGKPEEIFSKLAVEPTLKMYLLTLLSMEIINTKQEINNFFKNTFYASQFGDIDELLYKIENVLNVLKEYKFVKQDDNYFIATPIGKKVSEIYLNPDTANIFLEKFEIISKIIKQESAIEKIDFYSIIFFICSQLETRPHFRVKAFEEDLYSRKFELIQENPLIQFEPIITDYLEILNTTKTCDALNSWISEKDENFLFEKYQITPGEIHYKIETIDRLIYSLEEFAIIKKEFFVKNILNKLRARFKYGVCFDALVFLVFKGIGRVRARKLINFGIKKISDLKKITFENLANILGKNLATNIKNQLQLENKSTIFKFEEKPEEILKKEVSDAEVDLIIEEINKFENDKKDIQRKLLHFFK